jgi:hypothetical protein
MNTGHNRHEPRPATNAQAERPANDGESRYRRATSPDRSDAPLSVHLEFLVMDGSEGRALGQRQADVMRKVLQWIVDQHNNDAQ